MSGMDLWMEAGGIGGKMKLSLQAGDPADNIKTSSYRNWCTKDLRSRMRAEPTQFLTARSAHCKSNGRA
jgi:hypothetical protein